MRETEIMHRCTQCGKWSHAKKMPKSHQRFIPYGAGIEPDPATVITEDHGQYDHMNGPSGGGYIIRCGPFESWQATRVTP